MKKALPYILVLLNLIAVIAVIANVPAGEVATHYNVAGEPDAFGSKWWYLMAGLLPLLLLIAFSIYRRATRDNPKVQANRRVESRVIPAIISAMGLMGWLMIAQLLTGSGSTVLGLAIGTVGLLIIVVSNYYAKIQPNKTFGIRTHATCSDETVWRKTHRLSGILGTIGGLIALVCAIIGIALHRTFPIAVIGLLVGVVLTAIVPIIYAQVLYRKRTAS